MEDAFGTKPRRVLGEFETNSEAWRFVQDTHTGNQLVVISEGRKRAVFTWLRQGSEPDPNFPGCVREVYNLVKWEGPFTFDFGRWVPTGVQAAGDGEHRIVRTI